MRISDWSSDVCSSDLLFRARREMLVHTNLVNHAHPVRFEEGRIELRPTHDAPRDLANRTATLLSDWTGRRWVVSISREAGAPTLAEQAQAEERQRFDEAAVHPLVTAVKTVFPGAAVVKVVPRDSTVHLDGLAVEDAGDFAAADPGSEERRVGHERDRTWRYRWWPYHEKKKTTS